MANNRDGYHRTSDLYYAAYLKVAGVPFYDTERNRGRVVYLFEITATLDDLKRAYYNRSGKVSALSFVDEIKVMKALTYED